MKFSSKVIGIIQAAGITLYVSLFGIFIQNIKQWLALHNIQEHPILGIILFLLTFIVSALVCGSIVFTKPILLFFDGKRVEAFKVVLWSLLWLTIFLIVFGTIGTLFVIKGL